MAFTSISGPLLRQKTVRILNNPLRCLTNVKDTKLPAHKPPYYDYLSLGHLNWLLPDKTQTRFNENTKVITVAGSVLSGKNHLASRLADYFGMMFHEDTCDDDLFNHRCPNGAVIDIRGHNSILPKKSAYYTTELFWQDENPMKNGKPLWLQYAYYAHRFYQYSKGLCHLFNTGKGQIFGKDIFSEVIFAEAMLKSGLMSEYAYNWFEDMHNRTTMEMWRPHIIFYVKASKEQIKQKIAERNLDWEKSSPTLNDKFLDTYQECLESYLDKTSKYSEIVVIDRKDVDIYDEDDIKILVDKLVYLDLEGEHLNRDDSKFIDWRFGLHLGASYGTARQRFSSAKVAYKNTFAPFHAPLDMSEAKYSESAKEHHRYLKQLDPRFKYAPDQNPLYRNPLSIMFNPFGGFTNYCKDYPKEIVKAL
ncbi:NADH dehydrogenase (Ubiquinone) 1 alpha subcomplex [Cichlidogyrus casuarinus]|uniref:NADH dehydrogenase (Ubiquinone) 1 alpha subcomplex n=1 Tax=Cichlidogyrus casuarinus TaxID=1844966 RepID=A0ABD2Q8K8_9PLAT